MQNAKLISSYFYSGGVEAAMLAGCKLSRKLMNTLQMNSLPSDQLMLIYYQSLMNSSVSVVDDTGLHAVYFELNIVNASF